jgi:HSP20 family protein
MTHNNTEEFSMAKRVIHGFFVGPTSAGEMSVGVAWTEHGWQPRVDVYENADALYVTVDVAGVPDENLRVHYHHEPLPTLLIEGRRGLPTLPNAARCLQVEIDHGPFRREIRLPRGADGENISAKRQHGLLIISIPRLALDPPQSVKVTVS